MISFRNFALRRGERLLLSEVDLSLHAGWRVGVVGRNGTGKSSLFAAVRGEVEPDRGDLDLPSRLRIASIAQEMPSLPDPAIDFVLAGDTAVHAALQAEANAFAAEDWEAVAEAHQKLEEVGGYDGAARAGRLLHGLGFPGEAQQRPVSSFSGGWRVRLNLARALMTPSDVLLLDEPTNHLDLDAVLWLEQWLMKYQGTLLLISHDREFLDNVNTHTLHLHGGKAKLYIGNYTAFERQRAEQLRQQQITHEKVQAERAHLQSFIDRFKASAAKAAQAQSRVKRLAKLADTEAVRAEREVRIDFPAPARLPHALLRLNHADCGYPGLASAPVGAAIAAMAAAPIAAIAAPTGAAAGPIAAIAAPTGGAPTVILHDANFGLEAGDRIGLLGPNGAGKSTLVKSLVGDLPLLTGERYAHPDLRIGYFAQHTVEALVAGTSPIDHLREISPNASTQDFRNFLGKWSFPGDRAFESIDGFSGGERARLALALIAWRQPNVLLLDEPTNHLDLEMREALAEALSDFPGAIVLVSHDRHLIGLVSDTYWRVADGRVQPFDGDLDDYAAWLRSRPQDARAAEASGGAAAAKPVEPALPAPPPVPVAKVPKVNPHRLSKAEERVAQLEGELAALEVALADPAAYADGGTRGQELTRRQQAVRKELQDAEEALLDLYG
ncbi:ABC-F family ATP-binding cassette domain-containing protein [Luteimonas sp. MC1750]|uniref:ABC-F family ATP-binding cassette domain-containing protein n=1 Tax=Luteimonas sp. MC1750 TaxID=2799326 RepID=UPI0018F0D3C2|nr:ABC-F family ATP-binding cassette domain-containing protein [Luteimonas sp. MC1750]MBJ6985325.1 ABC-F family ATP-binding cassette domain-containing protein [Luteimonas sp. MC1750]QQO05413.1 ABC-F family ATP-binding cassette domain-containing protein [Luteimonas sp. MC1750]